jgi:hypothetical protein
MGDETATRGVWDVASGQQIATYQTAENILAAAAYRPGLARIAVLGPGQFIEILDARTGKRVSTTDTGMLEPWGPRRPLAYSPDGRLPALTKGTRLTSGSPGPTVCSARSPATRNP